MVTIESLDTTFETETSHGMETVFEQLFERWQQMHDDQKRQAEQAWRDRRLGGGGGGGERREREDSESTRRWRLKLSVEFMLDD